MARRNQQTTAERPLVVDQVLMQDFRGVPGELRVNLLDRTGSQAASILMYGENGSGKSSIIDAIEFGLRGRLSRRGIAGEKTRREIRNMSSGRAPAVVLTLSDGTRVRRGGGELKGGLADAPNRFDEVLDGFEHCPVVIRRHDVETFWAVPAASRQEFFFDYLRRPGHSDRLSDELARREHQMSEAQDRLAKSRERLARLAGGGYPPPLRSRDCARYLARLKRERGRGPSREIRQDLFQAHVAHTSALRKVEELSKEFSAAPAAEAAEAELRSVLAVVSQRVSADFAEVARKDWISSVEVSVGEGSSLGISVRLDNRRLVDPVQVLNEAALDLLALLILVEVHIQCAERGQKKILVLDDVFQSVDSVYRVHALDHVLRRLKGWQVILTLHDRLWLELARASMQRAAHNPLRVLSVRSTPHDRPPEVWDAGDGPLTDLQRLIKDPISAELVAGACGRALEQLCDRLSVSLQTSVIRRRGDAYTLGDLWPGVRKVLAKVDNPELNEAVGSVDKFLALRNLAGAHYNSWAQSLVEREALDFANGVVQLWEHAVCPSCNTALTTFRGQEGGRTFVDFGCKCSASQLPSD